MARCLESLRGQSYPQVEIVVVDNFSTDGTAEIARRVADVVVSFGPERSAQRNRGTRDAAGRLLFFVDSDMVLESGVVSECASLTGPAGPAAVVVPEASFGEGLWARCKAFERGFYQGDDAIEAARFFTRDAFEALGGYDEDLIAGEDWDLHRRARAGGVRIVRARRLIHHDEGHLRLTQTMAKKFYYGQAMGRYIAKHPQAARSQLNPLRPAFFRHRRELAARPGLAGAMLFMKACEFAAGAGGLLSTRLRKPYRPQ